MQKIDTHVVPISNDDVARLPAARFKAARRRSRVATSAAAPREDRTDGTDARADGTGSARACCIGLGTLAATALLIAGRGLVPAASHAVEPLDLRPLGRPLPDGSGTWYGPRIGRGFQVRAGFERDFERSVAHVSTDRAAHDVLHRLNEAPLPIEMQRGDDAAFHVMPTYARIDVPTQGYVKCGGTRLSPADALLHEAIHVDEFFETPGTSAARLQLYHPHWRNYGERQVGLRENPIFARKGESPTLAHSGRMEAVADVTQHPPGRSAPCDDVFPPEDPLYAATRSGEKLVLDGLLQQIERDAKRPLPSDLREDLRRLFVDGLAYAERLDRTSDLDPRELRAFETRADAVFNRFAALERGPAPGGKIETE